MRLEELPFAVQGRSASFALPVSNKHLEVTFGLSFYHSLRDTLCAPNQKDYVGHGGRHCTSCCGPVHRLIRNLRHEERIQSKFRRSSPIRCPSVRVKT